MKKSSILLMVGMLGVSALHAQNDYLSRSISDLSMDVNRSKSAESKMVNIAGTPYLADDFQPGNIYYDGKYEISDVPLRYNIYNDEMEFESKETIMAISAPQKIDKVLIGEVAFIFIAQTKGGNPNGYVKKWNPDYPALLTKMTVAFLKQDPVRAYETPKPARYERGTDEHYVILAPGKIENVKSVKKLIQILGDHQQELEVFAKKEKISNNDPEELASMLAYYHGLK